MFSLFVLFIASDRSFSSCKHVVVLLSNYQLSSKLNTRSRSAHKIRKVLWTLFFVSQFHSFIWLKEQLWFFLLPELNVCFLASKFPNVINFIYCCCVQKQNKITPTTTSNTEQNPNTFSPILKFASKYWLFWQQAFQISHFFLLCVTADKTKTKVKIVSQAGT